MAKLIYKPIYERRPDNQYHNFLSLIISRGEKVDSQQEEAALRLVGHMMKFNLSNGFPVITERDLFRPIKEGGHSGFHQALGELCAFLNGARRQDELIKFGCSWWKNWLTPEKCQKRGLEPGDAGPGFYGPAFRAFPTADGGSFDQITHIIEQIKELPHLRTHIVTPWIPQYLGRGTMSDGRKKQQKVVVVPCHGLFHVLINTYTNELSLVHFQRSADVPVGVVFNMIQYAALTLMIAQVTGYTPKEFVHFFSDAHIYMKQLNDVANLLATTSQTLPTVIVDSTVKDIFAFRPEHFELSDYKPQLPPRLIWTPI